MLLDSLLGTLRSIRQSAQAPLNRLSLQTPRLAVVYWCSRLAPKRSELKFSVPSQPLTSGF
jgi:hypothetical protein